MRPDVGRPPTSHERMTGLPWDASYLDGPAPWDIGRPQPAIVRVASEGGFAGAVLDAGCGTGENALHSPRWDCRCWASTWPRQHWRSPERRPPTVGSRSSSPAADALRLERVGRRFETVLDCGLFHSFDGDERPAYVASLASVTEHDGTLYVLCFSDVVPIPARIPSARTSCERRSAPAPDGTSPPSNRTGCSPASTTTRRAGLVGDAEPGLAQLVAAAGQVGGLGRVAGQFDRLVVGRS